MHAKYIVLALPNGTEQLLRFPTGTAHREAAGWFTNARVVSAGYCYDDLWVGGRSETLDMESRDQDLRLLETMMHGPGREMWDRCPQVPELKRTFEIV